MKPIKSDVLDSTLQTFVAKQDGVAKKLLAAGLVITAKGGGFDASTEYKRC